MADSEFDSDSPAQVNAACDTAAADASARLSAKSPPANPASGCDSDNRCGARADRLGSLHLRAASAAPNHGPVHNPA